MLNGSDVQCAAINGENVAAALAIEIEVLNGISDDEQIAENAQYLADSESFVKLK